MDHLVPPAIEVPEMYWVVSSRPISMWALRIWASEVKVKGCEGFHQTPGYLVCVAVKKRWAGEEERSPRNALNVLGGGRALYAVDTRT